MDINITLESGDLVHGAGEPSFSDVRHIVIKTEHGCFRLRENTGMLEIKAEQCDAWGEDARDQEIMVESGSGRFLLTTEPQVYWSDVRQHLEDMEQ